MFTATVVITAANLIFIAIGVRNIRVARKVMKAATAIDEAGRISQERLQDIAGLVLSSKSADDQPAQVWRSATIDLLLEVNSQRKVRMS